ncbi:uncharacterized protein N7458_006534 [Penicillium daleae]|uniref:Uncharacterized protein n=1 Tax=Penicillium daleae TaxID=63821 RepID=A0AAD6G2Z8_9EURO|nr:uncharacterized protein N7458_006534 [Penicillium daleae]KAJ5450085.1 hypothetical protein N7458_006534 [Penicillium daleae]
MVRLNELNRNVTLPAYLKAPTSLDVVGSSQWATMMALKARSYGMTNQVRLEDSQSGHVMVTIKATPTVYYSVLFHTLTPEIS